jgi:hypothetical protein
MRVRNLVLMLAWLAPALAAQTARADSARAAAAASDTGPLSLSREVFSYQGAGRDPYLSLLKSGDIRPLITDLKLVAIIYDERYAARSVAVLRDISTKKRYRVRTGDVLGRLRVTQIKPRDVVFTIQEFGFERQATLSLAKQEETP